MVKFQIAGNCNYLGFRHKEFFHGTKSLLGVRFPVWAYKK